MSPHRGAALAAIRPGISTYRGEPVLFRGRCRAIVASERCAAVDDIAGADEVRTTVPPGLSEPSQRCNVDTANTVNADAVQASIQEPRECALAASEAANV